MRYIIAPLDLTTEEFEIYRLLYKSMNFETYQVRYTLRQLMQDSNPILNLSKPKVNRIIKKFISNNLLIEIKKGNRGNPTIYKINKIDNLMKLKQDISETQVKPNRNVSETNKSHKINGLSDIEKLKQDISETQVKPNRNVNSTPINEKEKDKDNDINNNIDFIFNYFVSKNIIKHKNLTKEFKKDIKRALAEYPVEEIKKTIDHYSKMYHDDKYIYCEYKWGIHEFFTRKEGYKRFLDDGSKWLNYLRFCNSNKNNSNDYKQQTGSKFINFKQRDDWDFDEIEKLEREYLEKGLEASKS